MKDKAQLEALMKQGAERASAVAGRTLFKAKKRRWGLCRYKCKTTV